MVEWHTPGENKRALLFKRLLIFMVERGDMESVILPQLDALQEMREAPVNLYNAPIHHDALPMVYECLRHMGPVPRLDLVLSTGGGEVAVARRLALLLREF